MDARTLQIEIAKVCPALTAKVGVADDRTTWSFEPEENATQAEIDAGNNVIATLAVDLVAPLPPTPGQEVALDHENRILALEGQPAMDMASFMAQKMKVG